MNDRRVVVPLVLRVSLSYVVLAECSRVAFAWSRKRRGLHVFALLRTRERRVYITVFVWKNGCCVVVLVKTIARVFVVCRTREMFVRRACVGP